MLRFVPTKLHILLEKFNNFSSINESFEIKSTSVPVIACGCICADIKIVNNEFVIVN